jgi:hypothetical protein
MTNGLPKSRAAAVIIAACVVTAGAAPAAGATATNAGSRPGSASLVTATVPTAAWSGQVQVQVSVPAPGLLRAPVEAIVHNVMCGGCYESI